MREDVLCLISYRLQNILKDMSLDNLNEIRLRVNCPIILYISDKEYFVRDNKLTTFCDDKCIIATKTDIENSIENITNYSMFAYEDEVKQGFITAKGGHRVGICGHVVYDNLAIYTIRDINSINIRVSKEVKGCACKVIPYIKNINNKFMNSLIVSPPGLGKTTLLREIIRCISDGLYGFESMNVGAVDERCEICSVLFGIPQNDVGIRTDILDNCQKADGIKMLVRSMRPEVIAVDEIGNIDDCKEILNGALSGCKVLATVHAYSINDLTSKTGLKMLLNENIFERFIEISSNNGVRIIKIYDKTFKLLNY